MQGQQDQIVGRVACNLTLLPGLAFVEAFVEASVESSEGGVHVA